MSLPEDLKKEFPELEQPESLWETLERDLNELLAQHSSAKRTNVQTGFLKKVIKGSPSSNNQMRLENSGSRIASLSGLKEAPKLVDELSGNPMNSKARLDLVEMVIRKTDGILSFWRCSKFGEFRLMREGCVWLSQLKTDI